jgi:hypothetical protein
VCVCAGKTYTMIGVDDSPQSVGLIPCAISWLFRLISEQKEQTGARFSVRVSALEVTGRPETVRDLLADVATGNESGSNTAPGIYLRPEDPSSSGSKLIDSASELRAPSAERAAYYLDAAIAALTVPGRPLASLHLNYVFIQLATKLVSVLVVSLVFLSLTAAFNKVLFILQKLMRTSATRISSSHCTCINIAWRRILRATKVGNTSSHTSTLLTVV